MEPRDIISGDFYWVAQRADTRYLVLGDATGHGVPGALVTVLALTLLQEEVQQAATPPGPVELIAVVDAKLKLALRQRSGGAQDGFDLAIAVWNSQAGGDIWVLGAGRSLLVRQAGKWERIPPARSGLGGSDLGLGGSQMQATPLARTEDLRICLYTDGITDQFGGNPPRKLVRKGLVQWLVQSDPLPAPAQTAFIAQQLREFQGSHRRLDDVTLLLWDVPAS